MKVLGKCPYCDGQIEVQKKEVKGKKVELYKCSNAKWKIAEDEEGFELSEDSTCSFRIWQNSLSRYGHWLKNKEVSNLLHQKDVIVKMKSQKRIKGKERQSYYKYIALDKEYGVKVLFEIDVDINEMSKQ